jgi:hypothetical protein
MRNISSTTFEVWFSRSWLVHAHIPRDVLLPLLTSIAGYMDKEGEDIDGRPLLETIARLQNASVVNKECLAGTSNPNGNLNTHSHG